MSDSTTHDHWMQEALREAQAALARGETPVGAIVVKDGIIIGRGSNRVEEDRDATAHAEMIAIRDACRTTGYERLLDTTLYVTLEPCAMCAGAIVLARIPLLVFGADDPKRGACGSRFDIVRDQALNHRVECVTGIHRTECSQLLIDFFREARRASRQQ